MSFTSGRYVKQAQQVLADDLLDGVKNTDRAYDGKQKEFLEYCKCIYGSDRNEMISSTTVTEEKFFGFINQGGPKDQEQTEKVILI